MPVPDIQSLYQSPQIADASNQANQAAQTANNYQSAAALLPTQLKNAIMQKLNYNKDIIDQQAKAQSDYFAAPSQARAQYQDIANPFDREALVARATANAYAPYQSLTDILGQRQGNISDLVSAGTGAFNSQVTAEQGNAQIAQNSLQNLLSQADKMASAKEWQYEAGLPGSETGGYSAIKDAQTTAELQKDVQSGMNFNQLLPRYLSAGLDEPTIRQAYNSGPVAKKWGPAKETPVQESDILQGLPGINTGSKTASKTATAKWQVKNATTNLHQGGLKTPFGLMGGKDVKQTSQYLFDPNTGRSIHPDAHGNIHVKMKKTGETGYVPIDEFDSNTYEPV